MSWPLIIGLAVLALGGINALVVWLGRCWQVTKRCSLCGGALTADERETGICRQCRFNWP